MEMRDLLKMLLGGAKITLGAAFVYEGYKTMTGQPEQSLLGADRQQLRGLGQEGTKVIRGSTTRTLTGGIDERIAYIKKQIYESSKQPKVKEVAHRVLNRKCGDKWCVPEKNYLAEIKALFYALRDPKSPYAVRYTRDHLKIDQFATGRVTLGLQGGDCFVKGTLVLRDDHQLVPIESLRVGDRIWGLNDWSQVVNTWDKGVLPTWKIKLNNGSSMRLTPDHKVWVATCDRHAKRTSSQLCSCSVADRKVERVYVRNLKPGDVVLQPASIPFGTGNNLSPEAMYIEGLYIADGWASPKKRGRDVVDFCISGLDGGPKEEQKRRVEAYCASGGIKTYWHRKYIAVRDVAWAALLKTCGTKAPNKRVRQLNLAEANARALLEGILADSGKNTHGSGRTFTTTSRLLAVQARALAKMQGISCSERYIEKHGGLGKNPVWRLGLRSQNRADDRAEKLLRVKSIVKDDVERDCFDVATSDHYVWLPEADWTTSQCDDMTILLGALLMVAGYPVQLRVIQEQGASSWTHIYLRAGVPPTNPTRWIPLDLTVKHPPGWEVPGAEDSKLSGHPAGQVERVKDFNV